MEETKKLNFLEEIIEDDLKSGKVDGYVNLEFLLTGDEAKERARQVITLMATVTTTTLFVREAASTESAVLTMVPIEEELEVLEGKDGDPWVKIAIDEDEGYVSTEAHQSVINIFHIVIVLNIKGFLQNDTSGVDVFIEEERGDTRQSLSVDNGPVDRCRTTVLREQRRMDIERTESGHVPYHFWEHAEGHHHLEVGLITAEPFHEIGILHLHRLQDVLLTEAMFQGPAFHLGCLKGVVMTTYGLIGLGYYCHDMISILHECLECAHSKLGSSHKNDS